MGLSSNITTGGTINGEYSVKYKISDAYQIKVASKANYSEFGQEMEGTEVLVKIFLNGFNLKIPITTHSKNEDS